MLRQAAVIGLAGCATPEQLAAKRADPSVPVRLAAVIALRRLGSPAIAGYLKDQDERVVAEAVRGIHDDRSIPEALPALAALVDGPVRLDAIARRAMNACLRVGTPEAAVRLLAFALNEATPRHLRAEALTTLRLWKEPPRLDLVDGVSRPLRPAAIEAVLTPRLEQLLALTDAGLKTLGVEIMIAHSLKARPEQIAAIVADEKASGELRAQAIRLMAGGVRTGPGFEAAMAAALAPTAPAPLHCAALELLVPGDPVRLAREARTTLGRNGVVERQTAIALLAKAAHPDADAVLDQLAEALAKGTIAPAVKLDAIEALRARGASQPALAAKLQAYLAKPDATKQDELLAGGDILRGRDIVANHLAANCTACHSVEAAGGSEVGPNLRTIGAQRDSAYLLEALLTPSAKIATGYGIVNVTLKNKAEVTGTLASETADAVVVRLFDGKRQTIPRADIAAQTAPVSIMPPMAGILQPREIRDVVSYLTSLRGGGRGSRPATKSEGQ